jgi:hypothetical protein
MSLKRALELDGYPLLEIWNTHGGLKYARESSHFWDLVLQEGRRVFGVATDDSHASRSCGGGFVEVWAEELSESAILKALREGRFYASCSPRIGALTRSPGLIRFRTESPLKGIALMGDGGFFSHLSIRPSESAPGQEYSHPIPPEIRTYGRIEIEDRRNRRAWLQPVWAGATGE